MPGTRCAVALCNNSSIKTKTSGKNIMYHRFPKKQDIRKQWVQKCYRAGKWNPETSCVCSEHFLDDDYIRDLKAELMGNVPKRRLKLCAVPSINLKGKTTVKTETCAQIARSERMKKRENKALVQDALSNSEPCTSHDISADESANLKEKTMVETESCGQIVRSETVRNQEFKAIVQDALSTSEPCTNQGNLPLELRDVPTEESLQDKYINLQRDNEVLRRHILAQTEELNRRKERIRILQNELKQHTEKAKRESFVFNVKVALKGVLSETQLDMILNKKQKVHWSPDDISEAFAIRYFSKQCYTYLRDTLNYPLPGISTLQRWASKINMKRGIFQDVVQLMQVAGVDMYDFDRCTVLSFGELKLASSANKTNDEVTDSHSEMQVVMAHGLFGKWKQPVYVEFDKKITADILREIISTLHNINYKVVACVSNCAEGNMDLWNELGINIDKTYFHHPTTDEKIYMFADTSHSLKLLRNWFLDTGFILEDQTIINKLPLEWLIAETDTEVNACHKLTQLHITCERAFRQNLPLATQLFSHSTADALKQFKLGSDEKLAQDTGEFINTIHLWFELMNSYTPILTALLDSKKPYGSNIEEQNNILDKMYNTILKMRCCDKSSLETFQEAILVSISSLKDLFSYVQLQYAAQYILTHRLNQDLLNNLFSQIRTRDLSPLNAIDRIRTIISGKNTGVLRTNVNSTDHLPDDDEYILSKVFTKARLNTTAAERETEEISESVPERETEEISSINISSYENNQPIAKNNQSKRKLQNVKFKIAKKLKKKS